jgi:hypothetical protein
MKMTKALEEVPQGLDEVKGVKKGLSEIYTL